MLVPGNLSEIVDGGKMRRCRNVGEAHLVTGQPAPTVGQEADGPRMVAQVGASDPANGEVRPRDLARGAAVVLLVARVADHFPLERPIEPVHEPPHLGAFLAVAGEARDGATV